MSKKTRPTSTQPPPWAYDTYRLLENIAAEHGVDVEVVLFEYANERSAETMAYRIRHGIIRTPGQWGARVKRIKTDNREHGGKVLVTYLGSHDE